MTSHYRDQCRLFDDLKLQRICSNPTHLARSVDSFHLNLIAVLKAEKVVWSKEKEVKREGKPGGSRLRSKEKEWDGRGKQEAAKRQVETEAIHAAASRLAASREPSPIPSQPPISQPPIPQPPTLLRAPPIAERPFLECPWLGGQVESPAHR